MPLDAPARRYNMNEVRQRANRLAIIASAFASEISALQHEIGLVVTDFPGWGNSLGPSLAEEDERVEQLRAANQKRKYARKKAKTKGKRTE